MRGGGNVSARGASGILVRTAAGMLVRAAAGMFVRAAAGMFVRAEPSKLMSEWIKSIKLTSMRPHADFHGSRKLSACAKTCNLPGWRWATITKVALDRLSRSLHSDVCDSDGCCDAVLHSRISGCGSRRFRAVPNEDDKL